MDQIDPQNPAQWAALVYLAGLLAGEAQRLRTVPTGESSRVSDCSNTEDAALHTVLHRPEVIVLTPAKHTDGEAGVSVSGNVTI